jgi:hypothetical protein
MTGPFDFKDLPLGMPVVGVNGRRGKILQHVRRNVSHGTQDSILIEWDEDPEPSLAYFLVFTWKDRITNGVLYLMEAT